MKKLLSLLPCLIILLSNADPVSAQKKGKEEVKVQWYTFEQAVEMSKKNPKKIFIDVYTPWCHWCKVMEEKTYTNKKIAQYMNEHFYCVKFDAESMDTVHFDGHIFTNTPSQNGRKNTHALAVSLLNGQLAYPSLVFLDEENKRITLMQSYLKPEDFEPVLKYVGTEAYKTKKFDDYFQDFKSDL